MTTTEKTCEIRWYENGEETPDQNPAIGMCRMLGRSRIIAGNVVHLKNSRLFYICAQHARFISGPPNPEMDGWEFRTELRSEETE